MIVSVYRRQKKITREKTALPDEMSDAAMERCSELNQNEYFPATSLCRVIHHTALTVHLVFP